MAIWKNTDLYNTFPQDCIIQDLENEMQQWDNCTIICFLFYLLVGISKNALIQLSSAMIP